MNIILYGLSNTQKTRRSNLIATKELEDYIARVEADGGTVTISEFLLTEGFGMTLPYAEWWWYVYRVEEDGGTVPNENWLLTNIENGTWD